MRTVIVGAMASMDGVMQAPGGATEDPTSDTAPPSPSDAERARQERMRREG